MSSPNMAVWLDEAGARLRIGPSADHKPGKDEVLIQVRAAAVNPADCVMQDKGILIEKFPFILGCDAAGVVTAVGEDVTHVSVGSRVIAEMTALEGLPRAAFQKFAIAPAAIVCPIPDSMEFSRAAVIPLAYHTAIAGLYHKDCLKLPLPRHDVVRTGKALLVWGGASSVGCLVIQLAVASGLEVITTSSSKNFELCKSLGATEVFDYRSSTVLEDIKAAFAGKDCVGAYEASGAKESVEISVEFLSSIGGGFVAAVQPLDIDLPANVTGRFVNAATYTAEDPVNVKYAWQDFLPRALVSGQVRPEPRAEVVGKGLEAVQGALDTWRRGVSATKIVVEL